MTEQRSHLASQMEHLQAKHVGTGHADIGKHEWLVNQHRDSLASYLGHSSLTYLMALAENESLGRVRFRLFQKMRSPCGPPPVKQDPDKEE